MIKIQVLAYQRFNNGPGHIGISLTMENFAAKQGWSIERVFYDAGPAPKVGLRLGMQNLIATLDPEADERHVLIERFDRLDRRAEHALALIETLKERGVQIHSMDGVTLEQAPLSLSIVDAGPFSGEGSAVAQVVRRRRAAERPKS